MRSQDRAGVAFVLVVVAVEVALAARAQDALADDVRATDVGTEDVRARDAEEVGTEDVRARDAEEVGTEDVRARDAEEVGKEDARARDAEDVRAKDVRARDSYAARAGVARPGGVVEADEGADGDGDGAPFEGPPVEPALGRPAWIGVAGFACARPGGVELGGMIVAGIPLERAVRRSPAYVAPRTDVTSHVGPRALQGEDPSRGARAVTRTPAGAAPRPAHDAGPRPRLVLAAATPARAVFELTPSLARAAVAAAWRASGFGEPEDLDGTLQRARLAALLPEARLRAMRTTDQSARVDSLPDAQRTTDAASANLWLEARLTWRLDRLVYADDEPQLARIRADRLDARARVASRVLELLARWQRAREQARFAPPGAPEERDAELKALEATVALDVLTAGWFAARVEN